MTKCAKCLLALLFQILPITFQWTRNLSPHALSAHALSAHALARNMAPAGYAGIGLGLVPLEFKPMVFNAASSKAHTFPLSTFASLAAPLFDSIGLVS